MRAGAPRRVLIVDDNADAAELLTMILETEGYEVRAEYDGPAALKAACEYHPDVVPLDLGMPGMDGYEVAGGLRAEDALAGTVIVAVTGFGQDVAITSPRSLLRRSR